MRILVTGSSGYIGQHLVALLQREGHAVRTTDITGDAQQVGDLRDRAFVERVVAEVDAVAHLGAIPGPRKDQEEDVFSSNAQGTFNVLQACQRAGIERAVCFSSVNAFGSFGGWRDVVYLPGDDDYPCRAFNSYQIAKHAAEEVGRYFAQTHGMTVLCPRPTLVATERHYARWREQSLEQRQSTWSKADLWGYVDVHDVCEATRLALTVPAHGFSAFLLAADDTALEIPTAQIAAQDYPSAPWKQPEAQWLADNPYRTLIDCRVAKETLGWRPARSWKDAR